VQVPERSPEHVATRGDTWRHLSAAARDSSPGDERLALVPDAAGAYCSMIWVVVSAPARAVIVCARNVLPLSVAVTIAEPVTLNM
jgi:hypothetical protein